MADYKRITEYSKIEFASRMKGLEMVDNDLFPFACQAAALERYRKAVDVLPSDAKEMCEGEILMKQAELDDQRRRLVQRWIMKSAREDNKRKKKRETNIQIRRLRVKRVVKTSLAVFSGLTLLVPMLIMVLHPGLLTVTVTTSVFVLVVAVLLATFMKEAEPEDVVAATAAYAAVLVVFVGAGGSDSGGGSDGGAVGSNNGTRSEGSASAKPENEYSLSNSQIGAIVAGSIVGTLLLMMSIFLLKQYIELRRKKRASSLILSHEQMSETMDELHESWILALIYDEDRTGVPREHAVLSEEKGTDGRPEEV